MAIVYRASISPTKQEIVTAWLDANPGGGTGEVEMLGSYRFDDPAGKVGVESLVGRRGGIAQRTEVRTRQVGGRDLGTG